MNEGVAPQATSKCKRLKGRLTRFPALVMGFMEQYEDSVKFSARCGALDVYIGIVSSLFTFDKYGMDKSYVPVAGETILFTGKRSGDPFGHNDFQV